MTTPIAEDLRAWAAGGYPVEAATELLIRAFHGRFAQPRYPWIRNGGGYWVDFDAITDETTAVYSGGEQRVLAVVASLGGHRTVDLMETVSGLDRSVLMLVLAAIAHAAGSHQQADLRVDPATEDVNLVEFGSLFPSPGRSSDGRRTTALREGRSGGAMLIDAQGQVSALPPVSAQELTAAVGTVRQLADNITPACRGALLYDLVRAVYDSAKVTALTALGQREALADMVDASARYWSTVGNCQYRRRP